MTIPGEVLVVGASASGLATVETLRRKGYQGRITVLGDEPHAPYDRPPLSKQVLSGSWEPDRTQLRAPDLLDDLGVTFMLGESAVALDVGERTVRTESGRTLRADAVVIATGARPRTLPGQDGLSGVHALRTLDDSLGLRKELAPGVRLVVVGEGVLGAEIAATASALGADVTMTGPQAAPMAAQVGPLVADLLAQLHTGHGVRLRLGTGVVGFGHDAGRVTGVRVGTGETLPADLVVVAVGAIPSTGWLTGSGLRLDNGVVCDSRCRAADGIYAAGDVARWHHDWLGSLVRLENRTNATEQAAAVAGAILGDDAPYTPVPYFWSDQYDVKIQVHGFLPAGAEVDIVEGDVTDGRFVARYRADGEVTGILGWKMPKQARLRRAEITALGGRTPTQ